MSVAPDSTVFCVTCEASIPRIPGGHVGPALRCVGCVAGGPSGGPSGGPCGSRTNTAGIGGTLTTGGRDVRFEGRQLAGRILAAMIQTGGGSHLAAAALGLIDPHATAADLEARFAETGARLEPGVAERLLDELESLGLVRVASGGPLRTYVPSSLGSRLLERGSWTDAAIPLKDLERLRTDFLSTIAHELRTPITVMRTLTGLLLDPASDPTPAQRRTMLETMERNAERMQDLIGEILDLARYRAGTIRLQLRQFDAAEVVESAAMTIRPLAEQRRQRVELDLPLPPGPRVFGDRPRLDRALLNLVVNAHHFAPEGGRIDIALRAPADGTIRWSVTDDGPGISEDDQAHLFERFFVGRDRPKVGQEGVGLGLPRALAIAQAHGGTVEVRSSLGTGSTFTLVVPAVGPPEDA